MLLGRPFLFCILVFFFCLRCHFCFYVAHCFCFFSNDFYFMYIFAYANTLLEQQILKGSVTCMYVHFSEVAFSRPFSSTM